MQCSGCWTPDLTDQEVNPGFGHCVEFLVNTYGLLAKCEVKVVGYWPISSQLDRTSLVNEGFIIWLSGKIKN